MECGASAVPRLCEIVRSAPMRSLEISLAITALGELKDPHGLPVLIEALSYRRLQHYANNYGLIHAIANHGPVAVESLLPLAKGGPAFRRSQAMQALVEIGDVRAAAVFLEALRTGDAFTMPAAISGLAKLKDRRAAPLLLARLDAELAAKPMEFDRQVSQTIAALGVVGGRDSVDRLIKIVEDKKSKFRRPAIRALGELRDRRAIAVLIEVLDEVPPKPGIPGGGGGGAGAPAPPPPPLRELAARALAKIGKPAIPALRMAATDLSTPRGQGAVLALAYSDLPAALPELHRALNDKDFPKLQKGIVVYALKRQASPKSIPALVRAADEKPPLFIHGPVVEALVAIGRPAREPVRKLLDNPQVIPRSAAISVLSKIGHQDDIEALCQEAIKPRNANTMALRDFHQFAEERPHPQIDATLWKLAERKDIWVSYVLAVLARRPDVDADRLRSLIVDRLRESKYPWEQHQLLTALAPIADAASLEVAEKFLKSDRSEMQAVVCELLARHKPARLKKYIRAGGTRADAALESLRPRKQSAEVRRMVLAALDGRHDAAVQNKAVEIAAQWKLAAAGDMLLAQWEGDRPKILYFNYAHALAKLGDRRAIPVLLKHIKEPTQLRSLSEFGRAATLPLIENIDKHPSGVIPAPGIIGDPRAAAPFIKLLKDPQQSQLHYLAVIALGDLGDASAADALIAKLKNPGRVSSHFTMTAIGKLPRPAILPPLAKLLADPRYESSAALILLQIGTPAADRILLTHLPNASPEVRKQIQEGVPADGS